MTNPVSKISARLVGVEVGEHLPESQEVRRLRIMKRLGSFTGAPLPQNVANILCF